LYSDQNQGEERQKARKYEMEYGRQERRGRVWGREGGVVELWGKSRIYTLEAREVAPHCSKLHPY
jgi:hypothetical protein